MCAKALHGIITHKLGDINRDTDRYTDVQIECKVWAFLVPFSRTCPLIVASAVAAISTAGPRTYPADSSSF